MVGACSSSVASSTRGDRSTRRSFEQLDDALGVDRGPNGEPSASDFIVLELPPIVGRFATDFDGLPEIVDGVPAGRMLITSGVLVRAVAVFGLGLGHDDRPDRRHDRAVIAGAQLLPKLLPDLLPDG